MKTQIVSCPNCKSVLFDDATQCHECGHVIDDQSKGTPEARVLASDRLSQDTFENCPQCGESCRSGLVRCWSCGAFLRPEIEALYQRMRESGRYEVEQVELPIIEASQISQEDSFKRRSASPDAFMASHSYSSEESEGDDFELSGNTTISDADDEMFELNDDLLLSSQIDDGTGSDSIDSIESDVFRLQPLPTEPETSASGATDEPGEEGGLPLQVAADEPAPETAAQQPAASADPLEELAAEEDLLRIAADEERDIQQVRKAQRSKDTFLVYCPQGCRIRVKEKHRGKSGKCPRCGCQFFVPLKPLAKTSTAPAEPVPPPVIKYQAWMENVRLHTIDPLKLRIKADSLLNECESVELGFSEDDLLIALLIAGKFGANIKKLPAARQAMLEHFQKQGTVDKLTIPAKKVYDKELLPQFVLAQPALPNTESLFHDIPVFGTNRIAVRVPKLSGEQQPKYLSFCLSEFRKFVNLLKTICGVEGLPGSPEIPMTDTYKTSKCKISDMPVRELNKVNYYEKDPGFKLEVSGWRCAVCSAVISEKARGDRKLGGANGKGIAKAKCPGCSKPMGNKPLYTLVVEEPKDGESAAEE